ncbi:PQQ-dependent sugar dehydrogenase [Spirosoma validum]|uniref:PQQ-dependent sugar dehydrogenase n=1 Tax=Spirosoma validum TaxID=2771355 RepID=A0A927B5U5_9BACT|nr:PQQ-dependent sugar dehydrogenase [Spirosoma validum]MBD2755939.1 PQQ-dependent sugar dehydrogenase [Spirosoma validum]
MKTPYKSIRNFNKIYLVALSVRKTLRSQSILLVFLFIVSYCYGQTYPPGFSQVLVSNGLNSPTSMAFAPDGRIFVTEQDGKVRIIKNGSLLPTPFVIVPNTYQNGESGLNGIALDPDFANNGYVYVYHTFIDPPFWTFHNRISRFTAAGDIAIAESETAILDLDPVYQVNQHNGGALNFGPDGKLYIAVGDSRHPGFGQSLDTYMGKILRVNPDGSVPSGNPFTIGSEQRKRIWAYGLRNPFTFDIQPGTGRIFVNDVGESTWEEINDATSGGLNFGWSNVEGNSTNSVYTNPIYTYGHNSNANEWGCAITGGAFFNPNTTTYPAIYSGQYFYMDFCSNEISTLNLSGPTVTRSIFASFLPSHLTSLEVGPDGNLYFFSRDFGSLYKIIYTTNTIPNIVSHPISLTVPQSQPAMFSVNATGTAPLSYQWQKDGSNISGATSASYAITSTTASDAGQYQVIVSNTAGSATSNPATLSITTSNQLPVAMILSPTNHTIYRAGDVINFSGTAVDPEDGILPASAFRWTVEFHHNVHYHPGPTIPIGITNGQFTIPNQGHEVSADVFYRLILTVTDSRGGVATTFVDIDPKIVTINFATNPPGLTLTLDGQPVTTPRTQQFVSGLIVSLAATTTQMQTNKAYGFSKWTQGPDVNGNITIPDINTTYTANYVLPPDLTPLFYVRPTIQYGTTDFTAVVDIVELNSVATSGPITVKITRDSRVNLTLNPTMTKANNRDVQNNAWTFDGNSDPNYYVLTTSQAIAPGDKISFGLSGSLTTGATTGTLTISSIVMGGNKGELKVDNNSDADKIEYFQN